MASSLGVPVKLLHESLGHIITVELKTGQLYRGKLAEGTLFQFRYTHRSVDLTPKLNSGRLSQHRTQRYYCDWERWSCIAVRSSVHQGKYDQVFHRSRHVAECADVSCFCGRGSVWCCWLFSCSRFKRVGPNAMKGRGIGTARGRATIMRANGSLLIHNVAKTTFYWTTSFAARRGRGQPAARGIRR